jgi:hypothetical protein
MRPWRFWVELFDRREAGTSIAAVRIAIGLGTFASLMIAAAAGMVDTLWVDAEYGGFGEITGNGFFQMCGGPRPPVTWALFSIAAIGSLLVAIGLGARVAAVVTSLCFGALVSSQPDTAGGGDALITNALWLLALSRCDETLSLWSRLRRGRFRSEREIPAWPRYLMVFQLLVVYFAAGVQKTAAPWTPAGGYLALHYVLQDPTWIRFAPDAFVWASPLTRIASAVTWHWEQLAPVLLLYYYFSYTRSRPGRLRRWLTRFDLRKPWVVIGVGLHLGILAFLDVGTFSLVAASYYFALFTPAELGSATNHLVDRLRRLVRRDTVAPP